MDSVEQPTAGLKRELLINKTAVRRWFKSRHRAISDTALDDLNTQMVSACEKSLRREYRIERMNYNLARIKARAAAVKAAQHDEQEEGGDGAHDLSGG